MRESDGLLGILSEDVDPLRYRYPELVPGEVTQMVTDRIPRGARVLDVGCGTGSFLDLLTAHRGADVVGVEPNAERALDARSRGHSVFTGFYDASSAAELGRFDVILFADVLEHMPHPGPALRLASQWLEPGGCVIASIPNVAHWTIRLSLMRGKFTYTPFGLMDATHLRWFTEKSTRQLFTAAGFKNIVLDWTSGAELGCYQNFPLGVMRTHGLRRRGVRRLVQTWPSIFGFQHIVTAGLS